MPGPGAGDFTSFLRSRQSRWDCPHFLDEEAETLQLGLETTGFEPRSLLPCLLGQPRHGQQGAFLLPRKGSPHTPANLLGPHTPQPKGRDLTGDTESCGDGMSVWHEKTQITGAKQRL